MRILSVILTAVSLCFSLEIYLSPRYMTWEEFEGGRKLLREEGLILADGLRGKGRAFKGGLEIYGGSIKYDGQTQAGDPVKTDTRYTGSSFYIGAFKRLGSKPILELDLIYRAELWLRDIKSTQNAIGYKELWFYDLISPGVRLEWDTLYVFGRYGFMFRDARMQANIEGIPELRPKRGSSYDFGLGFRKNPFGVELSLSYVKFKRSNPRPFAGGYVLQPESIRRIVSMSILYSF